MKKKPLTINEFARLGGHARAASLSKDRLSSIAKKAAAARWKGHVKKSRRAVA